MAKFSADERELSAEICKNYPILADMGYSAEVLNKKQKAWLEIQKEYNSLNAGKPPRDLLQLKGLWKRLKMKTKAELDASKREARKTGGGPPTPPMAKPEKILADMFSGHFDPLPSTMDDDACPFQEGPGEESGNAAEEDMTPQVSFYEASSRPSKKKNKQRDLQERLLEMAEEEHKEKMKILKYKKEYQKLKILILEKQNNI